MSETVSTAAVLPEETPPAKLTVMAVGPLDKPRVPARPRLDSIDLLRGLVMVIMLLDHTRDFVHAGALHFDPTDLTKTSAVLFFTRWITHYCAPVFVFLAGTGAYFQTMRGKTKRELSRFLVTRGFWLIILEFTAVRFGFAFNFDYHLLGVAQVIWVIGVSMIVLAALIYLPTAAIAAIGIGMIALHNLADAFHVVSWRGPGTATPGTMEKLWIILHQPGAFPLFDSGPAVFALYPLVPWIGVMAAGYAFGSIYRLEAAFRRRVLMRLGVAVTAFFIIGRAINLYGDPAPWARQQSWVFTALSFLNVTKYPPSLLFLLMTLGPAFLFLAWAEGRQPGRVGRIFITFGRVPLFYYLLQWPAAHLFAVLATLLAGKSAAYMFANPPVNFPPNAGFSLWVVYLLWAVGLLLLYPLCAWFSRVKQRRRDWWLSYL